MTKHPPLCVESRRRPSRTRSTWALLFSAAFLASISLILQCRPELLPDPVVRLPLSLSRLFESVGESAESGIYTVGAGGFVFFLLGSAAAKFWIKSPVRLDQRVLVRAARFCFAGAAFAFVTESVDLEATVEAFFIISAFAFVLEHPRKARRCCLWFLGFAALSLGFAFPQGNALHVVLTDLVACASGLWGLSMTETLGLRIPRRT